MRVGVRVGHVGRASRVGESWCVINVSSTGSPHLQAQILLPTAMPNMAAPDWSTRGPQGFVRTAGVSAAASVASSESTDDNGPVPPAGECWDFEFRIGPLSVTGLVSMDTVNMLGNWSQAQTACGGPTPEYSAPFARPKYKAKVTAKGKGKGNAAGKSKPFTVTMCPGCGWRHVIHPNKLDAKESDEKISEPLPEFPGVGNKLPILYGRSIVFFSEPIKSWTAYAVQGGNVKHVVKWRGDRNDPTDFKEPKENWEKVKAWLRKYN